MALAPAPVDTYYPQRKTPDEIACKPLNTGVILFRKNEANDILFSKWLDIYQGKLTENSNLKESDQTSFVEALFHAPSRLYPLPSEWNARFCFMSAFAEPVKILHGHSRKIDKIARAINADANKHRVWIPHSKKCIVFQNYTWKHHVGRFLKKYNLYR